MALAYFYCLFSFLAMSLAHLVEQSSLIAQPRYKPQKALMIFATYV